MSGMTVKLKIKELEINIPLSELNMDELKTLHFQLEDYIKECCIPESVKESLAIKVKYKIEELIHEIQLL